MGEEGTVEVTVKEQYLDKEGNPCKKEDAVKVYVLIQDTDGNYIDGRMIDLV